MTTNQEGVHASVRAITGTSRDYLSDWHALFDSYSITAGPWNGRALAFFNTYLGTSYTALNTAMNAFAIGQGFDDWEDMTGFTLSEAAQMLAAETQGLALSFTDDAFLGRDGFYGSAEIKDTGTPANNYSAAPTKAATSLLTYASPSPKLTMGPDGLLRYQAHNLYLNSAAPANQAITVLSGATYAVTITGTVSVTASGAATGTWTAGTNTFTAATGTLTLGSTSGAGTVHVRRTPSDPTYLATTSGARYDLPYEWNSAGELQGILVEEARTNLCLHNRNLLGSGWSNLSVTAAKDATGIDGVANSASSLTSNSTTNYFYRIINNLSPNTLYTLSAYVRRKTGSGAVYFTPDFLYSTGVLGTESVTGPNLSTNGDFATNDLTGWTSTVTGTGTNDASSGACSMAAGTGTAAINQTIAGTRGKLYRATFDIVAISGSLTAGRSSNSPAFTTTGTKQIIIYALETGNITLIFRLATATHTATVDNIVVQEIVGESPEIAVTGNYQRFTRTFKTVDNGGVQSLTPAFSFATSGDAVEVDYIQVEAGGFVTSPIETFGSTVTRAADNISLATSAFPYSATAGTLFVYGATQIGITGYFAELYTDTNNVIDLVGNETTEVQKILIVTGGATVANVSPGADAPSVLTPFKQAGAYAANDANNCVNGSAGTTDTTCAMPSAATTLYIGNRKSGARSPNNIIKQFVYLPRRMSDAELQALTGA